MRKQKLIKGIIKTDEYFWLVTAYGFEWNLEQDILDAVNRWSSVFGGNIRRIWVEDTYSRNELARAYTRGRRA